MSDPEPIQRITEEQANVIAEHIYAVQTKWRPLLRLEDWDIGVTVSLEPLTDVGAYQGSMCVAREWEYLQAHVTVSGPYFADGANDDQIEASYVHELCHCLVQEALPLHPNEQQRKCEERVVTTLAKAFLATWAAGHQSAQETTE